MKKLTKTLLFSGVLSATLLLGACGTTSNSSVVTIDGVNIETAKLLSTIQDTVGKDNMKRVFLYEYLNAKYDATPEEIKERTKILNDDYGGGTAGVDYLKQYYGYDDAKIESVLKEEIQLEKALKEYKKITDKDLKDVFEREGNDISRKIIEVHLSSNLDKETISKYKDLIQSGKSVDELTKDIPEDLKSEIQFKESNYTNFDLNANNIKIANSKKGDLVEVDNSEQYGFYSYFFILDTSTVKFEDVKDKILRGLLYADENPEMWLYNQILETKNVKVLDDNFKYLSEKFEINSSVPVDSTKTESVETDSTKTESVETDGTKTEPVETDSTKTESVETDGETGAATPAEKTSK